MQAAQIQRAQLWSINFSFLK